MAAEDFPESKADERAIEAIGHQARNRLFIAIALIAVAVFALIWITRTSPTARPVTAPSATGVAQTPTQDLAASMPAANPAPQPSEMAAPNDLPPPPSPSVPVPARETSGIGTATSPTDGSAAPSASGGTQPRGNAGPPSPAPTDPSNTATAAASSETELPRNTSKPTPPMVSSSPVKAGANGYVLQLGVFTNYQNAKQLQERLNQAGIKSYTETRVHVGPFADKAEADQAREKMKALGIDGVIVPAH